MYTSIVENDVILAIVNTAMKNLSDEERIDRATVRIMNLINDLRTRKIRPEDLSKADAEVIAEVLSKI